jgi:hypothetical protein
MRKQFSGRCTQVLQHPKLSPPETKEIRTLVDPGNLQAKKRSEPPPQNFPTEKKEARGCCEHHGSTKRKKSQDGISARHQES